MWPKKGLPAKFQRGLSPSAHVPDVLASTDVKWWHQQKRRNSKKKRRRWKNVMNDDDAYDDAYFCDAYDVCRKRETEND